MASRALTHRLRCSSLRLLPLLFPALEPAAIQPARACWAPAPAVRVYSVPGSDFFLRELTKPGIVEIRSIETLQIVWSVQVKGHDDIFSSFRLSPDGQYLIHIKGNHRVHDLENECLAVYHRSGTSDTYRVSEFRDALETPARETSLSPKNVWLHSIAPGIDDKLVLQIKGESRAWVYYASHDIEWH